jgi:hypothetical protein
MQLLQHSNQNNLDNLNKVRYEGSRRFRNKQEEHLTVKINEYETDKKYQRIL